MEPSAYKFPGVRYLDDLSDDDNIRFTLGTGGENPLVVFGINPSTATPLSPDPTLKKVDELAALNGYDGWLMFNVYPKRDTIFGQLPRTENSDWHKENLKQIDSIVAGLNRPHILLSFGGLILDRKRAYLPKLFIDIYEVALQPRKPEWLIIDPRYPGANYELLTANGMPRHLMPRRNFTASQARLVPASALIPQVIDRLRKRA